MPVRKCVNRIPSSPVKNILEEEAAPMKQGIVTILGSDCEAGKAGSIRRTLSADMSSKKWLQQNGFFPPMKKIVSSEALVRPSEEEEEEIPNQDEVWRSIQAQKEIDQIQKPAQVQVWGLLLTQKSENSVLPPPYVHPLVKSVSSLSEKSLEICTESLGSETGSDCFSTHSCSEILTDGEEDKEDRQRVVAEELNDTNSFPELHVAQYKKSPTRPFPPPLPSIAGGDGSSLHMHSHRENGRLVVEAVSVPPTNYFHAQRHDGRLLLTLVHAPVAPSDESEKVFGEMEEVEEEKEYGDDDGGGDEVEEKDEGFVMKHKLSLHSGMIRVDKSCLGMKKLMTLGNINPTWPKKMNKVDEEEEEELPITQSLPPPHPATRLIQRRLPPAATSFNAYEYFWRKTAVAGGMITNRGPNKMNVTKGYENQDLEVLRGDKTEQFVPYFRGCKEGRRSTLSWESYCIATS